MSIAERLKEERLRFGLSQEYIAKQTGVSRQSQINYESGLRSPDANYLAKIGCIAGIDVKYILTGKRIQDSLDFLKEEHLKQVIIKLKQVENELIKAGKEPFEPEAQANIILNMYNTELSENTLKQKK